MPKLLAVFMLWLLAVNVTYAEIYRYQDDQGRWVYTDRPPAGQNSAETVTLSQRPVIAHAPELNRQRQAGRYQVTVRNIFAGPVQIYLRAPGHSAEPIVTLLAAFEQRLLIDSERALGDVELYWVPGPPKPVLAADQHYLWPVRSSAPMRIAQAFNGRFSHTDEPNRYAVDIATELGADVLAARAGTVMWVKDDYHLGAAQQFFLDKANYIYVLHDDGSYAVYAHILKGSARVRPGDRVRPGQPLARIGSSGFSTGPQLHFVIWYNAGMSTRSVPFQLILPDAQVLQPETGFILAGY